MANSTRSRSLIALSPCAAALSDFEHARAQEILFGGIRDVGDFRQNARHAGEAEDIERRSLDAMIHERIVPVQMGNHGLLGGPGQFQRRFDLFSRQEIGHQIFPSHAGAAQRSAIFSGRQFQGPLILGLSKMVDFNPSHRPLRVRVDVDGDKEVGFVAVGKPRAILEFDEHVSFPRHQDTHARIPLQKLTQL